MKRLLENACIWFLACHSGYTIYKSRQPDERVPRFVKELIHQSSPKEYHQTPTIRYILLERKKEEKFF